MDKKTNIEVKASAYDFEQVSLYFCDADLNLYDVADTDDFKYRLKVFLEYIMKFKSHLILSRSQVDDDDYWAVVIERNHKGELFVRVDDDWEGTEYPKEYEIRLKELVFAIKDSGCTDDTFLRNKKVMHELKKYTIEKYKEVKFKRGICHFSERCITKDLMFNFEKYPNLSTYYTYSILINNIESVKKIHKEIINTILSRGFIKYQGHSFIHAYMHEEKRDISSENKITVKKLTNKIVPKLLSESISEEFTNLKLIINSINAKEIECIEEGVTDKKLMDINFSSKDCLYLRKDAPISITLAPISITLEEENIYIEDGINIIEYKTLVIPKVYAPIKEYIVQVKYAFTESDRLQYVRDFGDPLLTKEEVINTFPIAPINIKVFDTDYINPNSREINK